MIWQWKIDVMVTVSNLKKKRCSMRFLRDYFFFVVFFFFLIDYYNLFLEKNSRQKFNKNVRNIRKSQSWHFILLGKTSKTSINPLEKPLQEALLSFKHNSKFLSVAKDNISLNSTDGLRISLLQHC